MLRLNENSKPSCGYKQCPYHAVRRPWGFVHFIGHSLGAHVVSGAAEMLKTRDNFEVDRVTGLDVAEPCFETIAVTPMRFSRQSGKFVDVIHTSVARSKNKAFGLLEPLGG